MKEHMEINKAIWDLKMVIKKSHTFNGARWKRPYFNNPGVYNIILNIQQLTIIHKALKKLNKQEKKAHLTQKWNRMTKPPDSRARPQASSSKRHEKDTIKKYNKNRKE